MNDSTGKAVVVSGDVSGNITSCRIENQLKSVQQNSAFSLTNRKTYITYDACNKTVLNEYTVPGMADIGITGLILVIVLAFFGGLSLLFRI